MIRHKLNIFLAVIIVVSLFAFSGCGENSAEPVEPVSTPDISSDVVEEVTVGLWGLYEPQSAAAIFISEYIESNYKIKLKPIALSTDDYQSELDWMVGANMLPDVFAHDIVDNKLQYKALITSGQIQSIPRNSWASYERLSAVMSWYEDVYAYKGQMYFIPRTYQTFDQTNGSTNAILYRRDWAKDLSKNTFGDTAEFTDIINLLSAYRNSDTDKNSIWDTWGLTGSGGMEFIRDVFLIPFGVEDWVLEDEKWIPGVISMQAKDAISWAAQLYREGIIDPAITTQTYKEALDKFMIGKSGAILVPAYYNDLLAFEDEWETHNPDKNLYESVRMIPSYTTPQGTRNNGISTFEGGSMISSNVSEGKLNKILALFDFMYSTNGRSLFENGTVNITNETESENSFIDGAPEFASIANLASWNLDKNPDSQKADSEFMIYAKEVIEKNIWPWSFDAESFTNGMITPEMCVLDINNIAEEKILHLIMTTRDYDADWDSYVQSMYNELNLEEAIAEVNARAEEYFGGNKDN